MIVVVFKSRDELVIGLKNGNKGMERWRAYIAEEKRERGGGSREKAGGGCWLEATAQQVTNKRRFTSHGEFPPQREPNVIYNWHGKGLPTWHCGRLRWRSRKREELEKKKKMEKKLERNRNKDTGVKGKERKKTVEERGPMGQRRKKKRLLRGG